MKKKANEPSYTVSLSYDADGNISKYVSESGEIVAHYDYSPFGEPLVASGPLAATFTHQFSTKPHCSVTGFSEYQMRKYRPEIGRWMSRDPIEESDQQNLFSFVKNDDINETDIYGGRRRNRDRHWGNFIGADRFIWHFYFGNHLEVDIGAWGYLGHYRSAKDVQQFECETRNAVRDSIDDCCAKEGEKWEDSYARYVDATDGLFVMGVGRLTSRWRCIMKKRRVVCTITFSITDKFQDPLDLDSKLNKMIPKRMPHIPKSVVELGGKPYSLTAKWRSKLNGCSEKEDCTTESKTDGRRRGRR